MWVASKTTSEVHLCLGVLGSHPRMAPSLPQLSLPVSPQGWENIFFKILMERAGKALGEEGLPELPDNQ